MGRVASFLLHKHAGVHAGGVQSSMETMSGSSSTAVHVMSTNMSYLQLTRTP
ncbi:hypothetical protein P9J64_16555 [Deltaproteobacteria bacterium IMCC39524]|nr:hypothetical protein [Deltaproteobacteria bacterium IMCC39524]